VVIVKRLVSQLSCAIAGTLVCGAAFAQSAALSAAVEAAWRRSAQARTAEGHFGLATAQQAAADSLWAAPPALELSYRSDRMLDNNGRTETEAGLAWPLLLPGQRSARQAAAAAERSAAEASLAAARLKVAGEVREAAWAVVGRLSEAAVASENAKSLEALANDIDRRVKAGDSARADALAARAEFLAASAAAAESRQRLDVARAQWKTLTGMEQVPDPTEPVAGSRDDHPELEAAVLSAQSAASKLDVVRNSRSDPPELIVRYRTETAASGLPAERTVGLAIRIPLGTDDRNLPREKAALAEMEVARAEESRQRLRFAAEGASARNAVSLAEEQVAAEGTRAQLLRERAGLIEKSFRAGDTPLPELLRANTAAAQAEAAAAGQRAALGLARARLNQVNGQMP
jgi:outer membrane protein TolC